MILVGPDERPSRCPRCHPRYCEPLTTRYDQARALGRWWLQDQEAEGRDSAPWCGRCDQRTRMVVSAGHADAPMRCPTCHPLHGQAADTGSRPVSGFEDDELAAPPPPPWCTYCSDPVRRQVDRGDGSPLMRCPTCHPLAGQRTDRDVRHVYDDEGVPVLPTPRQPWCTRCSDADARQVPGADGRLTRCPACHPLAGAPLTQHPVPELATAAPAPVVTAAAAHIRARMGRTRYDGWTPDVATEGRPKGDA